jgi:hypothetical protein
MRYFDPADKTQSVNAHIPAPKPENPEPAWSQGLPPLDVTDEEYFSAQETVAKEYGTTWQGIADSLTHWQRASDVLMDLARTEATVTCRERQLSLSLELLRLYRGNTEGGHGNFCKVGLFDKRCRLCIRLDTSGLLEAGK